MAKAHLPHFNSGRTKYRNIWTSHNGTKYASKLEAGYAAQLDLLVRAGEIRSWRRQVRIPLVVNERKIGFYVCDFEIRNCDDSLEYHEVKGRWLETARLKWKLFDALYPHLQKKIIQRQRQPRLT